jgi:hypothetical protein
MSCVDNPLGCIAGPILSPVTSLGGRAAAAAAGHVAGAVAGSVVQDFADACAKGADWAVQHLLTAWLGSPDPDVASAGSPAVWLQQRLAWLVPVVMLGAVLIGAWRLALTRRAEPGRELAAALIRTVAVTAGAGFVLTALLGAGDAFTHWILRSSPVDLAPSMVLASGTGGLPSMLVILLGLVVIITQIVQYGLMMVRSAMIVLLAGVLPVSAAASNTATGRQWWSKSVAWLLAFVLYKPVAALIYATAFRMTSRDQSATTIVSGVFLMVLAIFALPALLRFTVPATTAMAAGNAGAVAATTVGTLATGAVVLAGGLGGTVGGFAARTAAATPAMPTGAGSAGGVPAARAALVLQGVNGIRGKGSAAGPDVVGGNET